MSGNEFGTYMFIRLQIFLSSSVATRFDPFSFLSIFQGSDDS